MFQKIGYTLEHKWDALDLLMHSTEAWNSDSCNIDEN